MPKLTAAVPLLPATDLHETSTFWEEHFDFTQSHLDDGYLVLEHDDIELHYWHTDDRALAEASGCRFYVTAIETLYETCQQADIVHPNGELEEKPWGMREFAITDPSGNLIRMVQANK